MQNPGFVHARGPKISKNVVILRQERTNSVKNQDFQKKPRFLVHGPRHVGNVENLHQRKAKNVEMCKRRVLGEAPPQAHNFWTTTRLHILILDNLFAAGKKLHCRFLFFGTQFRICKK